MAHVFVFADETDLRPIFVVINSDARQRQVSMSHRQ